MDCQRHEPVAGKSCQHPSRTPAIAVEALSEGWEFRCSPDSKPPNPDALQWLPANVPGEVHTELLRHGLISDPFVDLHELGARWVGDQTWEYRTTFLTPEALGISAGAPQPTIDLVFEGLDTFATVTLNDHIILQADNMFLSHRVNINRLVRPNGTNKLHIAFASARHRGLELVREHPEHEFIVHQTEVSRGPVRKAQYHWGWDWGPILMACGPWKPIRIETYVARIEGIRADSQVSSAKVDEISVSVDSACSVSDAGVRVELLDAEGKVLQSVQSRLTRTSASENPETSKFRLKEGGLALWWPRGYGEQALYKVRAAIISNHGDILSHETQVVGFRKVELIQEEDTSGKSFYFRVNGVDIFSGGSCWIPADSFLSRLAPDDYTSWLTLLAEGNQIMIRVWGGGIYEHPAFYQACDALGLLVWQDFMFACAAYPAYPAFLDSVTKEATQAIRRLRQHPSIALWCGNNEDYQLTERYDLGYEPTDGDPQSWLRTKFPARYIYEHLLPNLVAVHHPSVPYHPSSPFGDGATTTLVTEPSMGDIHQWDVYNGTALPYQRLGLPEMGGRFISEFGMPALPHVETVHKFVTDPAERYPGSMTLDFHNKAVGHTRRLLAYMGENFRLDLAPDLAGFVHLSQVMQADAVGWAYKSWRRRWGLKGERGCGGVLVWQANDCWPGTSWAVVDYYKVRKPAWYAIKRALAPVAVAVTRRVWDWTARKADALWKRDTGHVDPREMLEIVFDVWVVSSRVEELEGCVRVAIVSVKTGQLLEQMEYAVMIKANGCSEVVAGQKHKAMGFADHIIIYASLWVEGQKVGSDVSWPDPIKYLDFSDRGVRVEAVGGKGIVDVSADKPVKGFVFSERKGVTLSENGFDVVPGETVRVQCTGLKAGEILPYTFVGR